MRKKELKLVITFHTTADAMAMEKECKKVGAQGRMIPVPRSISAGCGLSWCAPLECREELKNVMQGIGLEEEEIHECMVYEKLKVRKPQDEESFLRFPFLFYLTGNSENIFLKSFTENIRGTRKIIFSI